MVIYCAHSTSFSYESDFYEPLRSSDLYSTHHLIFPHQSGEKLQSSKSLFDNQRCDLMIAEVSCPSTGVGIEMGWADSCGVPILAVHRHGCAPSSSVKLIAMQVISYKDGNDLVDKIKKEIKKHGINC